MSRLQHQLNVTNGNSVNEDCGKVYKSYTNSRSTTQNNNNLGGINEGNGPVDDILRPSVKKMLL